MSKELETIVEVSCFEHVYMDQTKVELCGIQLTVDKGEKVALLGPNGGGKTTIIRHILGLLTPSHGKVSVFGVNPRKDFDKIRHKIGVVMQSVEEQLIGPTVIEDVMFSPLNYGCSKHEAKEMALEALDLFGITNLQDKIIHYLSGGEKRKVALAGAIVMKPDLLVLDEPFSALDIKSQRELINLINKICKERQLSVVMSTHDVESVAEFADTMYLISSKNKISRKGTPREILNMKDELEKFHLEEPSIIKLFNALKSNGIELGEPINTEEATEMLLEKLKNRIV